MSNRNLGILAVVAAVMVIVAVLQSRLAHPSRVATSGPTFLIQGLNTGEIAGIIVGHGDDAVEMVRRGGGFVVVDKANYPADARRINELLAKCLDIKTLGLYTSHARNHEALEVTEADAHGLVKFLRADGSLLAGVVVGKSPESGQGAFVRLAGSDDVFLADRAPWFDATPIDFVDAELFAVNAEDVNSVTVFTHEGAYTLRPREDGTGVVMEDLPAGKTLKTSDARNVLTALSSLRFDDVNTPASLGELDFDYEYVCLLDNSVRYTLRLARKDGKTYVQCEAVYTDTAPVTIQRGGSEPEEELRKKEAKLQAQEHALTFTQRHKGWVYTIPQWRADNLTKKPADLLEGKPEPIQEDPAEISTEAMPFDFDFDFFADPNDPATVQ